MSATAPYKINWLDLSYLGYPESIAIGALPGSKHRFIRRDYEQDLHDILEHGIQNAVVLCDSRELERFGTSSLLVNPDLRIYHYPTELGLQPPIDQLLEIMKDIYRMLERGEKCLIISRDGLGRSCVVGAALLLQTNHNLTYTEAFDAIKKVVGPRAIQTVKQYNFLVDYRQLRDEYSILKYAREANEERHISR